ncbi:MAG: RpiB/LacA/LacB family sugar-phosphate isomerase [Vulcanimicrobiaceae bacterium]
MRIALGSDMRSDVTAALEDDLRKRGFEVSLYGALQSGDNDDWPHVAHAVGEAVASGDAASGIVCCWSGTGVSIAANKVAGVRAALCADAQTASAAREWNDANVLALSLRATSAAVAGEILEAWFSQAPTDDPKYRPMIERVETG